MATQLENNINKLKESIYSLNYDISKSYLPDNEIIKNMILVKNPSLSKEDVEIMVDGTINGLTSSVSSTVNGLTSSELMRKEELSKFAQKNNIYPIVKKSVYDDEITKMKDDTRKSVMLLIKSQKDLIQDLGKVSIQITNSIIGASILIMFPSFNVPAAISLVMLIVDSISIIVDKIMNIIQHLAPLSYLTLLLPKNKFNTITNPINVSVLVLISLVAPIKTLRSIADGLVGKLKNMTSIDNLKSQISGLKDQLKIDTDKLAFLKSYKIVGKKKIPNGTLDQIDQKQKDVNDLKSRISDMENGYKIPNMTDGKISEEEGKSFLNSINPMIKEITTVNNELTNYIYDVYLQDGTVLKDITEEKLEEIKSKYTVIFD